MRTRLGLTRVAELVLTGVGSLQVRLRWGVGAAGLQARMAGEIVLQKLACPPPRDHDHR